MITLKYRRIEPKLLTRGGFYLLEQIVHGTADVVRIELDAKRGTELSIGGKRLKVQGGFCETAFSLLPEGEISVAVHAHGELIRATPLLKTEDGILRSPADEAYLEALGASYAELDEKVAALEKRISDIEQSIRPKELFKFN